MHKFKAIRVLGIDETLLSDVEIYAHNIINNNNLNYECDALLVSIHERVDQAFLHQYPHLRYLGVLGSSTKKIDLDYCEKHKIYVSPINDYCDHETAEWIILHLLQFFRERSQSLYEKTLSLVGIGAVGYRLAQKALGLGMNIYFNSSTKNEALLDIKATYYNKEEIFKKSMILSFHTPSHTSWLSYDLLENLPPYALLVNTCFGKICIDDALTIFLQKRPDITLIMDKIAAASYQNLQGPNIIRSMQAAYDTIDSQKRLREKFLYNINSYLRN